MADEIDQTVEQRTDEPAGTPEQPRLPWGKIIGGAVVLMAGTAASAVVATLAATHNTARHENLAAYMNGGIDTLNGVRQAIRDGVDPLSI